MRLLPRTLAGRVLLIIVAGLAVAHAASFTLFEAERARAIDRFAAAEVAARVVEYARGPSVVAQPRGNAGAMRPRLRWQDVETVGEPVVGSVGPPAGFVTELRRLLTESVGSDPVAWASVREAQRPEGAPPRAGPRPEGRWKVVTVALRLPDGRQALAEAPIMLPSLQVPAEAWISIALLFALTAMFSLWAVRFAVQPVRMLADAADRLSRNIDEPPLPERGAREIRAAARAFNRMQDRLRRHVNSRALAFAAMSHDIRTPITRMRLRLESLGERDRAKLEDDLREIESLARSALEVTRGLSADEPVVRVDIGELVGRLHADYVPFGAKVTLSGDCSPVDARPAALRRALGNLIDNGVKYGGEVAVELADAREQVEIRVSDRGPGIAPEHLPKVVYPFYRVDSSRSRDTGGAGLGLAIAKDIVEGHGGKLLLANRDGGGLVVVVVLPR